MVVDPRLQQQHHHTSGVIADSNGNGSCLRAPSPIDTHTHDHTFSRMSPSAPREPGDTRDAGGGTVAPHSTRPLAVSSRVWIARSLLQPRIGACIYECMRSVECHTIAVPRDNRPSGFGRDVEKIRLLFGSLIVSSHVTCYHCGLRSRVRSVMDCAHTVVSLAGWKSTWSAVDWMQPTSTRQAVGFVSRRLACRVPQQQPSMY